MLNQLILVGRFTNTFDKLDENEKIATHITLATPRSYKNENGEYETDFIDVILYDGIATNAKEYLKKGDLVGIKGRVASENNIIAEKITFLSSATNNKESEEK